MIKNFLPLLFIFPAACFAQINTNLIIGKWKFDKIVTVDSFSQRIEQTKNSFKEAEIVFKDNGEAYSTQLKEGKLVVLGKGKYRFSEDKKYFFQDHISYELIELTETNLVFKVSENETIFLKKILDLEKVFNSFKVVSLQSKIINSDTKEKIPNATIKNLTNNETTKASAEGIFFIKLNSSDSILITCIGYFSKVIRANDLLFVDEVLLAENKVLLNEVVVNANTKKQ